METIITTHENIVPDILLKSSFIQLYNEAVGKSSLEHIKTQYLVWNTDPLGTVLLGMWFLFNYAIDLGLIRILR